MLSRAHCKTAVLSAGSLVLLPLLLMLLWNAAFACNEDGMCQQTMLNESHLSKSLDQRLCDQCRVSIETRWSHLQLLHPTPVSTGGRRVYFWGARQNEWSVYPSLCLTLKAIRKSDKLTLRLSDSDALIRRPAVLHEAWDGVRLWVFISPLHNGSMNLSLQSVQTFFVGRTAFSL